MTQLHLRYHLLVSVVLVLSVHEGSVHAKKRWQSPCDQSSCYPATGDLLIGREKQLHVNSTCGTERIENYCIVSHLEEKLKCFQCDSRQEYVPGLSTRSHRIQNIVRSFRGDWKRSWWQARNGEQYVTIQLDLEAEFHFTHLIMRFKTFRPAALLVERSPDFGKTWKVYRYFAYNCEKSFPHIRHGPIRNVGDIICESRYSDVAPSTEGEVIFRVLPPSIEIEDPYSMDVQDLLKMTNLRVNFTQLHTLGDNLLDSRDEIKEKYYYALFDMVVRGSCSCYGHASRCVPLPGQETNPNMVHGQCECTHNTKGSNCQLCQDFYNDLPWRPARGMQTNKCKKCECNSHATRCHFDPAVYEATGRVSGGVCDDCMHNTMGRNCEECKPFFYKNPEKDIRDPLVCRSCDCDPVGSEHGGECESRTDPTHDLIAGRCICKRFVEGRRCDQCMHGYWNMAPSNPEGCERYGSRRYNSGHVTTCSCHTLGTVGNYGCDKRTGECRCKRFVTGRNCDQCLPQYWGLGDDIEGCKACNCDVGGSYDNNCDQQTGQCNCRPNIIGRHCDQPAPGFFITNLDYLVYEAEFAKGVGNTRVVIRESQPGRRVTWTGPGFMRVSEGDSLIFDIPDIPMSMEYDIVIRYEAQMAERWDDVRVTVIRPGPVNQEGPCANSIPQDDLKVSSLPRGTSHYLVSPTSCLEAGVSYQIRIDFNHYKNGRTTPQASVLIDAIALLPSVNSIPIFQGTGVPLEMRLEFEKFNCREQQMAARTPDSISDICKQHIFSISSIVQKGALDCQCDKTGSLSTTCDPIGGQCTCKHNVIGRTCDQCAPGTYNFSPRGCTQCNCNAIGSRDNFCEVTTGQCLCLPNVYGRQCDQCQQGFWGFPNCRPCQCNGRADICDNESGQCLYCRDNTGGHHCERCASGYYGDPRPGSRVGCRPCMCPGGMNSGFQHADTCRLDTRTNQAICDCKPGYTGSNCNRCANNYFGNPLVPGGTCQPCQCNNNIDPASPGNCDASTGRCLQCIYNTEGFNCERCSAGYYGNAREQNCQACVCNLLGTDRNAGPCDPRTGQCACLPNVIGLRCDSCAPNFWKIASGLGCESCNCDPRGSHPTQCNEFDGQCQCITGRGGRTCADCENNYWGDPSHQCFPCDCNQVGSATLQCDRRTGSCECLDGVGGHKCDRCARGTTGNMPHCMPCGECFDDWDQIIMELNSQTNRLIQEGSEIKVGGVKGIFEAEFRSMEDKLDEVRRILAGTNVTQQDLDRLQDSLNNIRQNLTDSNDQLNTVDQELIDTNDRIETANNRIESIRRNVDNLKMTAEELKQNATRIREMDIIGAYNSTLESERRSEAAQWKVDSTGTILDESVTVREQVDIVIEQQRDSFDERYDENEAQMTQLTGEINDLDGRIVDLNEMVCDGRGDPCDSLCGGAGCGKCGGLSCDDGSVTKASNAMDLAKRSEKALAEKTTASQSLLSELRSAEGSAKEAKAAAQEAYDSANGAKNESESTHLALELLMGRITEFMEQNGAKPAEIRQVAEEVLGMTISLQPEEIRDLARQINDTIRGLTDIETILAETKDDLERANNLKHRAAAAKEGADNVLDTAQRVLEALKRASEAQDAARNSIAKAEEDIMKAEADLVMIESETTAGVEKSRETLDRVNNLKERLDNLKTSFTENEINVQRAANEADVAEVLANQAELDADDLDRKYSGVAVQLELKYNSTRIAKEQADDLRDRASRLYQNTYEKIERLKVMGVEFDRNEKTLGDLSHEIDELNQRMKVYFTDIQKSARRLRTCG